MKKTSPLFLALCFSTCLAMPAFAADKTAVKPKSVPASSSVPTPVATPVAESSATPVTPPPAPEQATKEVKSGVLDIFDAHLSNSGSHVDIFLSVKNTGKADEKIGGAGTSWTSGNVVQITKDKDGKEQESSVAIALPAGKTTELSKDGTWIRIKDVKTPKKSTLFPLSLYFRSSPNADLKIDATGASSGGLLDWLKK